MLDVLKKYKWYDNPHSGNEKHISASSFANETLEIWFGLNGYEQEEKLSDATIGSLVHLGMEKIFTEENYKTDMRYIIEQRYSSTLEGMFISGSPDLIDTKEKVIYDYKTAKNYSKKMLAKEGKYHRYAIQLAIYKWLLSKQFDVTEYKPVILWIMKDSSAPKGEPVFIEQEIEIMTLEEIEEFMIEKIKVVSAYDKDTMPDMCKDLWTRNINKTLVNTKCSFYCGYKKVCPYFKPSVKQAISAW